MNGLILGIIFGVLMIPISIISYKIYRHIRDKDKNKGGADVEIDNWARELKARELKARELRDRKMKILALTGAGGAVAATGTGTTTNVVIYDGMCCGGGGGDDGGGCGGGGCGGGCG